MFFSRPAGHKFVDRGIFSEYDFSKSDIPQNNEYHTLSLSLIIPKGNIPVLLQVKCEHVAAKKHFKVRKKGATNDYQAFVINTQVADVTLRFECVVWCNTDKEIECYLEPPAWGTCDISVMGWWV